MAATTDRGGGLLPGKLLRLGVRYADGSKATTIEQRRRGARASNEPPPGPLLSWSPGSSGTHGRELGFSGFGLWLWPLPPAESFEFAVEMAIRRHRADYHRTRRRGHRCRRQPLGLPLGRDRAGQRT
jgi:hypothetical protein